MAVREQVHGGGIYFITFTCIKWIALFKKTNSYDLVYKWFDELARQGHFIIGYSILPNHLHVLIGFQKPQKSINMIISNAKRFLAYALVKRLKEIRKDFILELMNDAVTASHRRSGKIHQVFEPSFDCTRCNEENALVQILEYIHNNPCQGKWRLAKSREQYPHSSAKYYDTGMQGAYPVTNYVELRDVSLVE